MKRTIRFRASMIGTLLLAASVYASTAHAIPVEVLPVNYSFSAPTSIGDYNYSDRTGTQLIDEKTGSLVISDNNADEWVAWYGQPNVDITFDFGQATVIDRIEIGSLQISLTSRIVLPSVAVSTSDDGVVWTSEASLFNTPSTDNNSQLFDLSLNNLSIDNQYVRISLQQDTTKRWTFVDEINFYVEPTTGAATTAVPEPGTILLLGCGLLGLGLIRQRRKIE